MDVIEEGLQKKRLWWWRWPLFLSPATMTLFVFTCHNASTWLGVFNFWVQSGNKRPQLRNLQRFLDRNGKASISLLHKLERLSPIRNPPLALQCACQACVWHRRAEAEVMDSAFGQTGEEEEWKRVRTIGMESEKRDCAVVGELWTEALMQTVVVVVSALGFNQRV